MSTPSQRLAQLGLELPPVAAPVAAYQPAARFGNQVMTSGQLPFAGGTLIHSGKVGAEVSVEDAQECARLAGLNALAAAAAVAGGLDRIASVVKLVVFVASDPSFTGQPQVANGASELMQQVFGSQHARSAVGVSVLPLDAPVEVELIAELA
ncbi:MAG: RidA family protein [Propionibacteriaceae bacterium]|nr:RidA family protein [Propionibacteriaceae bacterium]